MSVLCTFLAWYIECRKTRHVLSCQRTWFGLTFVATATFHSVGSAWVRALRRLVLGRPAQGLLSAETPVRSCVCVCHTRTKKEKKKGTLSYPQLRHANGSRRGSGQSRARWPTALQFTHFTSTRSTGARSSLQLRAMCPISFWFYPSRVS